MYYLVAMAYYKKNITSYLFVGYMPLKKMIVGTNYINISKTKNRQQQQQLHPRLHFVLHFVIHLHTYSNQDRKYHPLHHHHYNQLHPLDQVQVKRVDVSVQGTLLKCTLKIVGHCLKIYLHQEFKHICW